MDGFDGRIYFHILCINIPSCPHLLNRSFVAQCCSFILCEYQIEHAFLMVYQRKIRRRAYAKDFFNLH